MALSRRDVERARSSINTSLNTDALRARVTADLDVVKDAYDTASISLVELSKALARIDSIATQEGSGAAVKAFREIAAAQKDIASTLIALRAEGRTTIRETLAAAAPPEPPPQAPRAEGEGMVSPSPQEFSSPREANPTFSEIPDNSIDSEFEYGISSDSAPAANNHEYSEVSLKKGPAPDGAGLFASPLGEFLKANRSPK